MAKIGHNSLIPKCNALFCVLKLYLVELHHCDHDVKFHNRHWFQNEAIGSALYHFKQWLLILTLHFIMFKFFSHHGQNCPENTWERTGQSSGGWCKTAPMTSQRSYWRDVAIHSDVMTLCFEQLKRYENRIIYWKWKRWRKIINHYTPEGTRESHSHVHDLWHPWLGKPRRGLQIMDTRIGLIPLSLPECSHRDRFY